MENRNICVNYYGAFTKTASDDLAISERAPYVEYSVYTAVVPAMGLKIRIEL